MEENLKKNPYSFPKQNLLLEFPKQLLKEIPKTLPEKFPMNPPTRQKRTKEIPK